MASWCVVSASVRCSLFPLSLGFSLALTSLFLNDGFALNVIIGGSGNMWESVLLCLINFQCLLKACFILGTSSQNFVMKMTFGVQFLISF